MATQPPTMKIVRIQEFGGPEVVGFAEADVPFPGPDQALLKVRAASVNPVDWKTRMGQYPKVDQSRLPYTLGSDVTGEVVACGSASSLAVGSLLYALVEGGFAEYVLVKDEQASPIPSTLSPEVAAAVPLAGLTAWQGLFRHGGLSAGQRVLIHAGAGGVGHLAVQFAKAKGAFVATTVSASAIDFARQLGADQVIDHAAQRFEDEVSDIDVVFDLVGGETTARSWSVLKKGGILVSTVGEPPKAEAERHGVRATVFHAEPSASELREIAALIEAGQVKPVVSKRFPFSQTKAALQAVEDGHTVGKVIVTMDAEPA